MGKRTLLALTGVLAIAGAFILGNGGNAEVRPAATRASTGDASAEGIKVHGHWELDIYNADGELDRTVAFENALVGSGPDQLANVLGRVWTSGAWAIRLVSAATQPCDNGTGPESCLIWELAGESPNIFTTLTLDMSTAGELTLAGQATIANTTTIDAVQTEWLNCAADVAPDACLGTATVGGGGTFTNKLLADTETGPVNVTEGQIVQASVTLSFS